MAGVTHLPHTWHGPGKETTMTNPPYPIRFTVDYPDRQLARASTFFRIIIALPVLILLGFITGGRRLR
jgi:hypothetical protein